MTTMAQKPLPVIAILRAQVLFMLTIQTPMELLSWKSTISYFACGNWSDFASEARLLFLIHLSPFIFFSIRYFVQFSFNTAHCSFVYWCLVVCPFWIPADCRYKLFFSLGSPVRLFTCLHFWILDVFPFWISADCRYGPPLWIPGTFTPVLTFLDFFYMPPFSDFRRFRFGLILLDFRYLYSRAHIFGF